MPVSGGAVARARQEAARFAAGERPVRPVDPRRRWIRRMVLAGVGVLTAGAIVLVTGWPVEGRPSLSRLREVQHELDVDIEQSHAQATTGLDLWRGVVVLRRHEDGVCEVGVGLPSAEDWALVVTERDHRTGSCGSI